jgi:hypothetical protein
MYMMWLATTRRNGRLASRLWMHRSAYVARRFSIRPFWKAWLGSGREQEAGAMSGCKGEAKVRRHDAVMLDIQGKG